MKKIRIGVLGCSSIAERSVIPAFQQSEYFDVISVASRSEIKAKEFSKKFSIDGVVGYEKVVNDSSLEAVYIPLPTGMHLHWGSLSLNQKKHILFEKSLAQDLIQTESLVSLAKKQKVLIDENYMFVDHSQQKIVQDHIKKIGEIRAFRSYFGFPPLDKNNFRYDPELGGGALLDAGGYVIKSLEVFFPKYTPKFISSHLNYENGVDIAGSAYIRMQNQDKIFSAYLSFGFDNYYRCGIEVWGSEGALQTDRTFTAGPDVIPKSTIEINGKKTSIELKTDNHFLKKVNRFGREIISGNYERNYTEVLKQASLQDQIKNNER